MSRKGITVEQAMRIRAEKGLPETKLQRIRAEKGLSQRELAEKTGIPIRTISSYEQMERRIEGAKLNSLCSLCLVLECKIEDIIEDEETIKILNAVK